MYSNEKGFAKHETDHQRIVEQREMEKKNYIRQYNLCVERHLCGACVSGFLTAFIVVNVLMKLDIVGGAFGFLIPGIMAAGGHSYIRYKVFMLNRRNP